VILSLLAACAGVLRAEEPSPREVLQKADARMAPADFESDSVMTTHRTGGATRSFAMHVWKRGAAQLRVQFTAPADDAGSEVLRDGESMWSYLPNLKRALRISPKQEFHGGDFNNTDILRVNLLDDYDVTLLGADASRWLLELKAKNASVSYARIKYWVRRPDFMPLRQEFYSESGKLIRVLDLAEARRFDGVVRPSRLVMHNALAPERYTEMEVRAFSVRTMDAERFSVASLGR
jgi:outer membrane lipoprotein-sorting protein